MAVLLLRSAFAMLIAFAGGAVGVALGNAAARRLKWLVIAALAALLAVTLFDVLPDAKLLLNWTQLLLAAGSGGLVFWLLGRYLSPLCPACSLSAFDPATTGSLRQTVTLLMVALGLHSAMDGVAVVVGDEILGRPNLALLLAVSFHKLPEGMALALLLLGAGYSRREALLWTLAVESTTMLGAVIGVFGLRHVSPFWLGLLFAHVGGGFVYLILSAFGLFAHRRPVSAIPATKRELTPL